MAQQKVIIIPAKWIVIILTTFFTLCIIAFFIENKRVENYRPVEKKDSINLLITNKQSRGGIFINDSLVIASSIPFIYVPKEFQDWDAMRPIISFSNKAYEYKISDVQIPYQLLKKKNNDTVFVIRKKDTLLLLLSAMYVE
ncbi:hypothetical protein ACFSPU_05760 [Haoranjiania flava]|uniref:Uncharacterized protein n=1 Tax=Haoranjiania flava TaxID=1856322 RepID=A0AAE3IKC3_9BACT|nr:hypothetical protein [Haoranjiania flava]MCU7693832.1 hypothetical protein [Haoranjiania flava]